MAADDFYRQLRERVAGYTGPNAEYVLLAPDLFVLLTRLMLDPRVDTKHKALVGAALAYVVSPIDLLPERVIGLPGYLDDVAVAVAVLNIVLNEVDQQVVLEHWSGKGDLLGQVQKVLAQADQMFGKGRLDAILESLGIGRRTPSPSA